VIGIGWVYTSTEKARTCISSMAVRVSGDTAPSFAPPAAGIHGQQLFIFALPLKAPRFWGIFGGLWHYGIYLEGYYGIMVSVYQCIGGL
jgi:hypothetical protein